MKEETIHKFLEKLPPFGWAILFGVAWVWCWIVDTIWTPIWWFFNKKKFEIKEYNIRYGDRK